MGPHTLPNDRQALVVRNSLLEQADQVQKTAEIFYLAHSFKARRWEMITRVLLVSAATLAAAGGVAAAASLVDVRIAGVTSVVAGALGGLTLTLDTMRKSSVHQTAADNYINFAWIVRNFRRLLQSGLAPADAEADWRVIDAKRERVWTPIYPVSYDDKDYLRAKRQWTDEPLISAGLDANTATCGDSPT